MLGWVRDIANRRELVWILIERNLKIRYKSSFLGFFWSLLSPLFLIFIYSLFLGVLKFPIHLPTLVTGSSRGSFWRCAWGIRCTASWATRTW
jgi:ABC-type polysaccharide/polyol phosphate export permease